MKLKLLFQEMKTDELSTKPDEPAKKSDTGGKTIEKRRIIIQLIEFREQIEQT